jgi:hypothetical protein
MATVMGLFGRQEEPEARPPQPWPADADEHFYMLDQSRNPVPVASVQEHMDWYNSGGSELCSVAATDLRGGWEVITSFEGTVQADEDVEGSSPLFRTLVIMAGDDDDYVDAYPTWEAAEAGHRAVVARYKKQLGLV